MFSQDVKLLFGVIVVAFIILHVIDLQRQEACTILIDGSKVLIQSCNLSPEVIEKLAKLKPMNHGLSLNR
ncbi:triple gene block protein 3 [Garlic yellow mosaic-associated virus]|nr:triple gene block protein 3 [Garlic yellow mosaic-associated virus]